MLYRMLLTGFADALSGRSLESYLARRRLKGARQLDASVTAAAAQCGLSRSMTTLRDAAAALRATVLLLPAASDTLIVNWEQQRTREALLQDVFHNDACWLADKLRVHMGFWTGAAAPNRVPLEEMWKCRTCPFSVPCQLYGCDADEDLF